MHTFPLTQENAFERILSKDDLMPNPLESVVVDDREGSPDQPWADLVETVRQTIETLESSLERDIQFQVDIAPGTSLVRGEPAEIRIATLCLVGNRLEAVPDGGVLLVETFTTVLDESHPKVFMGEGNPGEYTVMAVSDSGLGMDREALSRMFKAPPAGVESGGLTTCGLHLVRDIVERWGGHIWKYSEPGHGTQVEVFLPVVRVPGTES